MNFVHSVGRRCCTARPYRLKYICWLSSGIGISQWSCCPISVFQLCCLVPWLFKCLPAHPILSPGRLVPRPGRLVPRPGRVVLRAGRPVPPRGLIVRQAGRRILRSGLTVPRKGRRVPHGGLTVPVAGRPFPGPGRFAKVHCRGIFFQ
jgi:hypothetical protein